MTENLGDWLVIAPIETPGVVVGARVQRSSGTGIAYGLAVEDPRMSAFEREERLWQQLALRRMAKWRDGFVAEGKRWFVIDDVSGPTLATLLAGRRTGVNELLDRLDEVLALVAEVHALVPAVVLRNFGPDSVIVRPDGLWLVSLSGATDEPVTDGYTGTFGYAAPEQYEGESGPACDVYAVGAMAAWMFTRQAPRSMDVRGRLDWRPHTKVPPEVADWVDALLDPDPARRPSAVAARKWLTDLRRRGFQQSLPMVQEPGAPAPLIPRSLVLVIVAFTLTFLLVMLAGSVAIVFTGLLAVILAFIGM